MFKFLFDYLENIIRYVVVFITNYLPVKVIRHEGRPFLYRYYVFSLTNNGPGICFHNFVKSDPDRGYHDHPWDKAISFILCGEYTERILNSDKLAYKEYKRNRFTFNYLNGHNVYHRVMIDENKDAWTIFFFQKRTKIWSMVDLKGQTKQMTSTIEDQDGGWWNHVIKGLGIHQHLELNGKVIPTVDIIVTAEHKEKIKLLLIKRGKDPCKGFFAFPGGRVDPSDDDILFAANRELKEETHLENLNLKYITSIGNKTRDPRGFTVTNVFAIHLNEIPSGIYAGDDAVDLNWYDIGNLPPMAFDHKQIFENYWNNKKNE